MNSTKLQYRIYRIYMSLMFIAMLLSIPLAFILPIEVSFENGLLENAQVVVLVLAAILILKISSGDAQMKWLERFFAAGFILMALRELSWGRVFFQISTGKMGPSFVSMADFEYRVPVYIFLAAYISAMLFILIRFIPVRKILLSPQPLAAFAVIVIAIILNYVGEHGYFIGKECGQILEELNELILYMTLPATIFYYKI